MLKRILRGALLLAAAVSLIACREAVIITGAPTTPAAAQPTADSTGIAASHSEWIELEVRGVTLGIEKPAGWEVQRTENGVMLAEHFSPMLAGGEAPRGVLAYIFVHSTADFRSPADSANVAWAILDQITHEPSYIGEARVNEVFGFKWGQHDAAYYLSNNGDGHVTMLLAVAMPDVQRLVVFNFTARAGESGRIRDLLPRLLSGLVVNGVPLDAAALDQLPDPLVFPTDQPTGH